MRVTILGAGAVGGWLAAGLARAGVPVGVLARGASLAALRANGLVFLHGDRRKSSPSRPPTTRPRWPAPTCCCSG